MIYYAAFPAELAFEGHERFEPAYLRIPFARGSIIAEVLSPTSLRIVSLHSSDIQDYLEPLLQPGRVINLQPGGLP
ncbi:MAG TPA: hypothetical protein GX744_08495 [Firmicutes bacterium]|jgi:hypothetical protein|nr:hypothetical protein [Bacillota bacterium]